MVHPRTVIGDIEKRGSIVQETAKLILFDEFEADNLSKLELKAFSKLPDREVETLCNTLNCFNADVNLAVLYRSKIAPINAGRFCKSTLCHTALIAQLFYPQTQRRLDIHTEDGKESC